MRHRHVERGQALALTGDPISHLIVIAQGRLGLSQASSGGREHLIRTLGPGQFLGELALFAPAVYEGDLVALEASDVCELPREAVQQALRSDPDAALRLLETLAQRLADAERRIGDLGLRDVGQRLAGVLLDAAVGGEPAADGLRVRPATSWREVAASIGTTPESLSRRLRTLEDRGLIRMERGRSVLILDLEQLRRAADR